MVDPSGPAGLPSLVGFVSSVGAGLGVHSFMASYYTILANSDFHGHRPAVKMCKRFCGVYSGTITSRLVHPASPVLLTKNDPLVLMHSNADVELSNKGFLQFQVENNWRQLTPNSSNNKGLTEDRDGFVSGDNIPGWSIEVPGSPAWSDSYELQLQ
ncbi:hypothetical protein MKX08_003463 [Trichoderma sp. CBMAI-0020]|nr:hypothetical protein MKX08_003463 [Trichoderma sp. CBMAI-0020]